MTTHIGKNLTFSLSEIKPCLADNMRVRIIAQFEDDLTPILEILFLHFRNANYSRNLASVTTKRAGHSTTVFGSGKVAMTYLKDEQEGIDRMGELAKTISKAFTYLDTNGQVDSDTVEKKENINALQIHKLLPQTDCGECSQTGCFAFATLLMNGERIVEDCGPIMLKENADRREVLVKVIQPINLDTVREDKSDLAKFLGLN